MGSPPSAPPSPIHAPRGGQLHCRGWEQEAALRMLMNSLDPEVAERPESMDRACYLALVSALTTLGGEETLLVQSGKAAGVFPTHRDAPRVLIAIANADGAGSWAQWDALSWLDIGPQARLQGAYEIFAGAACHHFGGSLAGKLVAAAGMGGTGGVQPLAATLNGAAFLGIEADAERIKRRLRDGYCDIMVHDLDEALRILKIAVRKRESVSVGLVANCAEVLPEMVRRGVLPDLFTDESNAHDPVHAYIPAGLSPQAAAELRRRDPEGYRKRARDSSAVHIEAVVALWRAGAVVFDSGHNLRAMARQHGVEGGLDIPGAATYLQPMLSEGRGRLRWVALSGEASDIHAADARALELFPEDERLRRWLALAKRQVRFQGLPARASWLGSAESSRLGWELNAMVKSGHLKAPMVIGSDHCRQWTGAAPQAAAGSKTAATAIVTNDAMAVVANDAWDAGATEALFSTLLATAGGACWVSMPSSRGASTGGAPHASRVVVADGTDAMASRLQRVLNQANALELEGHAAD